MAVIARSRFHSLHALMLANLSEMERVWRALWGGGGLFLLLGALLVFAQRWWAPGWRAQIGGSFRELSVLVFAFGFLEQIWEQKDRPRSFFFWITGVGLALFALGNMMDARFTGAH